MLDQSKAGRGGEIKATSKPEPDQATSKPEQPETINEERCKKNTTNKNESLTKNATNTQANPSLINTSAKRQPSTFLGCRRGVGSDNRAHFSVVARGGVGVKVPFEKKLPFIR